MLWRRYLRPTPGLVERTLDRIPVLLDLGEYLPVGTRVVVELPAPGAAIRIVYLYTVGLIDAASQSRVFRIGWRIDVTATCRAWSRKSASPMPPA